MVDHKLIEEYCDTLSKYGVNPLRLQAIRDLNARNNDFIAFNNSGEVTEYDNQSLRIEVNFFEQNRQNWFKHHAGKIALVHKTTIHGFYDNYEDALKAGYDKCGLVPFLMKEVLLEDRIETIF